MFKTSTKIKCAHCFKALGIPSRIEIYRFLRDKGETSVSDLVEFVKLTQPTVSYHLKEMKGLGLLSSRKTGKEVYYKVNKECRKNDCDCILHIRKFPGEED
jgi:ArsR family transcriptional regulator, arsenate/arsenite/antimonite-responsive transcriptional repressor